MMLLWKWELKLWNWRIWFLWRSKVVPFSPTKWAWSTRCGPGPCHQLWHDQENPENPHLFTLSPSELSHTKQRERKNKNIPSKMSKQLGFFHIFPPSFQVFFYTSPKSLGCLGFPSSAGPWFRISSCRAFPVKIFRLDFENVSERQIDLQLSAWKSACMLVSSLDLSLMEFCGLSDIKNLPSVSSWQAQNRCLSILANSRDHHRYCHPPSFLFLSVPSIVRITWGYGSNMWFSRVRAGGKQKPKEFMLSMVKWCQIPHVCWSIPRFLVWPPPCGSQSISPSGHCLHLDMLRRYWLIRSWLERSRTN